MQQLSAALAISAIAVVSGLARADTSTVVHGTAHGLETKEPVVGATVVIVAIDRPDPTTYAAITDDNGKFALALPIGRYRLTLYYLEFTTEISLDITPCAAESCVVLAELVTSTDSKEQPIGCIFPVPPIYLTKPHWGFSAQRGRHMPIARTRDHFAGRAPVTGAGAVRPVTTIGDDVWLPRRHGIPLEFLDEVTVVTSRAPVTQAIASGGAAEVMLRTGSNRTMGDARAIIGVDGGAATEGAELFSGGALVADRAWAAGGVVVTHTGSDPIAAQASANLVYAASPEHRLTVLALGRVADARDGWASASWISKFDDAKLQIRASLVADYVPASELGTANVAARTAPSGAATRVGSRIVVKDHWRGAGHHDSAALVIGGTGALAGEPLGDLTVGIGDDWQPRPTIDVSVGVRNERRWLGRERVSIVAPRAAIIYDPTDEGRAELFAAYQRVPHVDDGSPGDWRTAALFHDEVMVGVAANPGRRAWVFGVAGRARRQAGETSGTAGVDVWVRYEGRSDSLLHLAGSTLDRVVSMLGERTVINRRASRLTVTADARIVHGNGEAGIGARWHHDGKRDNKVDRADLAVDVAVEGYASRDAHGARLLVGVAW